MKKKCFKCGHRKDVSLFYKHSKMADGLLGKCKECAKRDAAARYYSVEGREMVRAYEKLRFATKHRKLKLRQYQINRRKNRPGVDRARVAVGNALRDGRLERKPCEVCGECRTQAHHDDYRKKLSVRWLCFKHHREVHGQIVG
jgi:hypothetical protein